MEHATYNLPGLGLIVNKLLRILICTSCGRGLSFEHAEAHINAHFRGTKFPDNLVSDLCKEFNLVHPCNLPHPKNMPRAYFGLEIFPEPFFFCTRCGHGYSSLLSLRKHQNDRTQTFCPEEPEERHRCYYGYAQTFITGPHRSYFRVDISHLQRCQNTTIDVISRFRSGIAPPIDFSKVEYQNPINDKDLGQFMHRERWMDHIEGMSPQTVAEACRTPQPTDGYLHGLIALVEKYVENVQPLIRKHASFGIPKATAQIGE
jgi:hypothetical protein